MDIHGYVWLYMGIHEHTWLYMDIHEIYVAMLTNNNLFALDLWYTLITLLRVHIALFSVNTRLFTSEVS